MGHFSDSLSVLPSDVLAAGGTVVEDAAPPSQIMVLLLPLVAAIPGNQDDVPTPSDIFFYPLITLPVRIPAAFSQFTARHTVPWCMFIHISFIRSNMLLL
jgi:hypothetical protein